jgi:hypothetical protein
VRGQTSAVAQQVDWLEIGSSTSQKKTLKDKQSRGSRNCKRPFGKDPDMILTKSKGIGNAMIKR